MTPVKACGNHRKEVCGLFLFSHTYDQDVVELLHAVYLRQQLVDHGVVDSCATRHAATLFTDCINLIEYDDVKAAVGAELRRRQTKNVISDNNIAPFIGSLHFQ